MRAEDDEQTPAGQDEAPGKLRQRAMRWLGAREYSRLELSRKLTPYSGNAEAIETVLDELVADGWQSDRRFAESFVRGRIAKGQGRLRIERDLQQCGIAQATLEAALLEQDVDWLALGVKQFRKRFGSVQSVDYETDAKNFAKQLRFLLYRGFTQDQARAIINYKDDEVL